MSIDFTGDKTENIYTMSISNSFKGTFFPSTLRLMFCSQKSEE